MILGSFLVSFASCTSQRPVNGMNSNQCAKKAFKKLSSTMTCGYLPDIYKFMCVYIDTLLLSYLFHAATTESWLNHLEVSNGASEQSTRSQSA